MRRLTGCLIQTLCLAVLLSRVATAGLEVGSIHIYGPGEVLDFCSSSGDLTRITFPGSREWVMLGNWEDYHPMPVEQVTDAVRAVTFPMESMEMHVLVLPAPRLALPNSSAEGDVVFLSPGRIPYPEEHVHYTVAHEIGHVVHHLLMPDHCEELWRAYADLRMVEYADPASPQPHASHLHEIFAEDFRVLFGGEMARCGGEVENHDIIPPDDVEGLKDFFLSLVDRQTGEGRLAAYPNPFESSMVLKWAGSDQDKSLTEAAVIDVLGRTVRMIRPSGGDGASIVWDGNDSQGRPVAPGVYMVAARTAYGLYVRKVVKTLR
ncbi:MAG: T9SS type A sorting domain-containing protein [Candidatus Eisenbacteria bacterium]